MNENKNRQQNLKNNGIRSRTKIKGFFRCWLAWWEWKNRTHTHKHRISEHRREGKRIMKKTCNFNQPQYLRTETFFHLAEWLKWEHNENRTTAQERTHFLCFELYFFPFGCRTLMKKIEWTHITKWAICQMRNFCLGFVFIYFYCACVCVSHLVVIWQTHSYSCTWTKI